MPEFIITSPDGRKFRVSGPPGSTKEQALAKVRAETASESGQPGGYAGGLSRAAMQGAFMGWGDEALAAARAGIRSMDPRYGEKSFGDHYEEAKQRISADMAAFREDSPVASTLAEFGGAIGTGGVGTAKLLGTPFVRGLGLVGKSAAYAGAGAAEGALAGAGYMNEDRTAGAALGGSFGGAFGAAAPAVGSIARRGVEAITSRMGGRRAQTAAEYIGRAAARDDIRDIPGAVLARGEGAMPLDTGRNVRGLAETIYNRPGTAQEIIGDVLDSRRAEQATRIIGTLEKNMQPFQGTVMERVEMSPAFRKAVEKTIPVPRKLLDAMRRYSMKKAWGEAVRIADEMGSPDAFGVYRNFDDFADAVAKGDVKGVKTELMHYLKKGLDDVLEKKRDDITGKVTSEYGKNLTVEMENTRRLFRDTVKELNPEYGDILDKMSAEFRVSDALDEGKKIFDRKFRSSKDVQTRIARMKDPREIRAFQSGVVEAVHDKIADKAFMGDDVSKSVAGQISRIRAAFGDKGDEIARVLKNEVDMMRNENAVMRGSQTAARQAASADLEGGMRGNVSANISMRGVLDSLANWATQPPSGAMEEAARLLTTTDPAGLARLGALLAQAQSSAGGVPLLASVGRGAVGTAIPETAALLSR